MIVKPGCAVAAATAVLAYNLTIAAVNVGALAKDPTQPLLDTVEWTASATSSAAAFGPIVFPASAR